MKLPKIDTKSSAYSHAMSRGLNPTWLKEPIVDLTDVVQQFSVELTLRKATYMKKEQLAGVKPILENPFHYPYLLCVASADNDSLAKTFAAQLFLKATAYNQANQTKGKTTPLWHIVGNKWDDTFTNRNSSKHSNPSLIVLSNMTPESPISKIDPVRDMLETNSIPRILVVGGCDPISFCYQRLRLRPDAFLYLG